MTALRDKIQVGLDETRILVLCSQVLVGFQLRGPIEPGFDRLPRHVQFLKLASLGALLVGMGLLMLPPAYHRIVERGDDTRRLFRLIYSTAALALVPFAIALSTNVYGAVMQEAGMVGGLLAGAATALAAIFFWYGLELARRDPRTREAAMRERRDDERQHTPIQARVHQVLTEARVVLPGAQALLGFQLAGTLMDGYEKLPPSSRWIHLGALLAIALAVVLLMAPPAYHRIVERGEDTERFHLFAGRTLVAAMVCIGLGVAADFFVVLRKVVGSLPVALVAAAALLVTLYGLWFGYTLARRWLDQHAGGRLAASV